jgi:hypothetical protein
MTMAYVYRHIRLDKNEPFYIGIGTDSSFARSREKTRRSEFWNKIVSKTDYEIEILFENIDIEEAKRKEIEFISLYGRKNLGTGILVNLTNGGDGAFGRIHKHSEETKKKISDFKKGKPSPRKGVKLSEEAKTKISKAKKGKSWDETYGKEYADVKREKLRSVRTKSEKIDLLTIKTKIYEYFN